MELFWEQLLGKGLEHLILHKIETVEAQGLVVGFVNDTPYRIQYRIVCDVHWNVQKMRVADLLSDKVVDVMRSGNDWLDEKNSPIESLHGCTDVDIMVTPFTNTLPIQRLKLKQGEAREISVVYVSIPDINLSRLDQRYTYLSQNKDGRVYKYESLDSGFTSNLQVDEDGLVVDYPGIFKLVWKRTESS